MSSDPYTPDNILGQEFMTWLWYRSDASSEPFTDKNGRAFSISPGKRMTVEGGAGDKHESAAVSVSDAFSPLREARFGIAQGKKVSRCLLCLERDDMTFEVTLRAKDFSLNSLKTPKVVQDEADDEPDALFLEKIALIESVTEMIDSLYLEFLRVRLDDGEWEREVLDMQRWTSRTE